jgi:succinate dehydrogenase / fumarate reductase membrane anchor subunit
MVNRVIVGAHYGLRDWLVQRVTAVIMAIYLVVVGVAIVRRCPHDYESWRGLFQSQCMRIVSMLFVFSLLLHAWIGMRDILMDYVKSAAVRLLSQVVVIVLLTSYGLWAAQILWRG